MPAAGYAIRAGFTGWGDALVDAAMALETVGEVTGPVEGGEGYSFLQYSADVPAGMASVDVLPDALIEGLLEQKQQEAYDAALAQWLEAADVMIDLSVLNEMDD